MPKQGTGFPFLQPYGEVNIVLGESVHENGGITTSKRLLKKETDWDCHQTCQMHTPLMESQGLSFHVLKNAHYFNTKGVFTTDFPDSPPIPFNYTGAPLTANLATKLGTGLNKIVFNSTADLVLQDTNLLTVESIHSTSMDPAKFNLVDPPERNTVGVPTGGWTAIRFRADNPALGVLFMHRHLELHTSWGLKTASVVENGKDSDHSVLPPPTDLPPC
ncbi:laccase-11 [Prunus yedoensis var. nudiflora]|uniref:Laccase-11 n=1 Tax=Prunus yedoensis var. nudiflora TaxID=2094558 RepID=A0A314YW67_PRUYE|nr:laccase-11 [Prunus yedoensis var. nudiflora]